MAGVRTGRNSLAVRKLLLPYAQTLQRVKHDVVNETNVTSLSHYANRKADALISKIGATAMSTQTMTALAAALLLGAATAAVAVINYDVNASPAASTPQNNAAAVAAQNPGAGCDTNEAPIFRGQRPLHY